MSLTKIALLILLFSLLTACSLAEDITPPPGSEVKVASVTQSAPLEAVYPLVPPDAVSGKEIYLEKCAPCHGESGLGDGTQTNQLPAPPTPLSAAEVWQPSTPVQWYQVVTQGRLDRFMPPFSSLSDRQRWDVVAYLYTLSTPPETLALAQELYQNDCAGCHGSEGRGDGTNATMLTAKPTAFTNLKWMVNRSGVDLYQAISQGVPPAMPAFQDRYSPEERWALVAYLRQMSFASSNVAVEKTNSSPRPTPTAAETTIAASESESTIPVGRVSGQVVHASGMSLPPDLQVTLYGFDNLQQTLALTTTIQNDGRYLFASVEMPPGRAFIAAVEYQGTRYGSDVAVVEAEPTDLDLPIPIFETTTDTSALSVDRLHIFFDYLEPQALRVVQLYIISNPSDRTVVAPQEGEAVLTFDLPEGATNLQFEDSVLGERYIQTPNGFGDTAVIRPGIGRHQVVFAFDMPYKRKLALDLPMKLPINAVVILVPEGSLKVKGDSVQDAGKREVQGMAYHMYTSESLPAGGKLSLTISGKPQTSPVNRVSGSSGVGLAVGLVAFSVALILTGVWLYRRGRPEREALLEQEDGAATEEVYESAEVIMDAILALDDLYQAAELPEAAYRQRRAELKARLKEKLSEEP